MSVCMDGLTSIDIRTRVHTYVAVVYMYIASVAPTLRFFAVLEASSVLELTLRWPKCM